MEYEYACCPNGDCRQVCVPSQRGWSVTNGQTAARGVIEASLRARREFTVARSKWIVAVGVPRRSLPICGCSRSNSGAVCCRRCPTGASVSSEEREGETAKLFVANGNVGAFTALLASAAPSLPRELSCEPHGLRCAWMMSCRRCRGRAGGA